MAEQKNKGPSITLNEDTVLELVAEAKNLIAKIESFKTERAALEASTLAELVLGDEDVQYVHSAHEDLDAQITALVAQRDEGKAWIEQKVSEAIDKVHKGVSIDVLREQATDKANRAKVISGMLGIEANVPTIPGASSKATSTGPRKSGGVTVTNARYYRVVGGEKTYQSAQQNSLSSLAFYYSKYANPDGVRMGVADFTKVLVDNGLDKATMAKPWGPIDVGLDKGGNLVQVGMDVTEDKATEDTPAE